jgi:hypothetical protein
MRKQLTGIMLGTALAVLVSLPVGQVAFGAAEHNSDCHKRLEKDKARIDHDSAKYGEHSRRVDKDVDRLDSDRQWCREHHQDWDHSLFDVGIYIKH